MVNMVNAVCWFVVAVMFILATAAVAVVLIMVYDLWKESDFKQDLDEWIRNRRDER